jgi:hypothetical protein
VPPSNKEYDSNLPIQFFLDLSQITLIYALLSRLRAFWGGTLGQNLVMGAQKHFNGPGLLLYRWKNGVIPPTPSFHVEIEIPLREAPF